MSAIEQPALKVLIEDALGRASDLDADTTDPQTAREQLAEDLAEAIAAFVIGRQTVGPTSDGATATTIVQ
jgi:hypothetical protein